jgi:hypothetical protein
MKTTFTKQEILNNKGCYSLNKINSLLGKRKKVKIIEILSSPISIRDKCKFVYNACDLSLDEKKKLALKLAWIVLPIHENKYPNDSKIKDCLQAIEDFYTNKISFPTLKEKRKVAEDIYADSYADDIYAYVSASAAHAYAAALYNNITYAVGAAACAVTVSLYDFTVKSTYPQLIQQTLINFVK